jgi:hypothetical protein
MNMRIKFTAFAVAAAGLSLLSGCHTAEAPKYSDLVKAWREPVFPLASEEIPDVRFEG